MYVFSPKILFNFTSNKRAKSSLLNDSVFPEKALEPNEEWMKEKKKYIQIRASLTNMQHTFCNLRSVYSLHAIPIYAIALCTKLIRHFCISKVYNILTLYNF